MAFSPITSRQIEGEKVEVVTDFLFLGFQITVNGDCGHEIRRWLHLSRKAKTNLDSVLKSRDITLLTKVCMIKAMIFPVVTYGYESWTVKKAEHIRIDAFELVELEDSYEALDSEIKPVNLIGHQPWTVIGRTDAEAETPLFWSPDANRKLIGKVPDGGKDWGQKEKRASEDEMAGWHHQCNGHEFGQISGYGEGQGGLACYGPRVHKELDTTGWLNNKRHIL